MRTWDDLLVGAAPQDGGVATIDSAHDTGRRGWMGRLRDGLSQSRRAMTQQLAATVFDPADQRTWERIEEGLIAADVGVASTVAIVERLEGEAAAGRLSTGVALAAALRQIAGELVEGGSAPKIDVSHTPTVVMLVGVNGTGKTTTVGKLAARLAQHGKRVSVAAADTFRAAATEQLEVWAERAGARFVRSSKEGGDPASVAYDAVKGALDGDSDVVLIDTAGRLHTKHNLMQELAKIGRVIDQLLPGAPHVTLLTIDATTGQNGMRQAREFSQATPVDGIVLTKLDGSAKGGIALAIAHELHIPIVLVGIGESLDDLQPFDAQDFLAALFPDDLLR